MAKSRKHPAHPLEDSPFVDGLLEWVDSPEGQEYAELSDVLWPAMKDVRLDASQRKFVWSDGVVRSFGESASRLHSEHPEFALKDVRDFLISWIELHAPEGMSQEQLDELDRLTKEWAAELR
jgi:hypothetical protein